MAAQERDAWRCFSNLTTVRESCQHLRVAERKDGQNLCPRCPECNPITAQHLNSLLGGVKQFCCRTSLVAQWLRIRLPMQGTRVRALVREDPTCRGATKPLRHNY
ncbi:hypothetical protein J1605_017087 [Eschrichtius robustus]|uniref:Uncharacterized protein n=1 Tax=Eschrichtius robustus TaxID=9764 RepID=A0AB34I4N1_ESCRO|nr:hypothetical protein J1605_017087 [Eschrichtius robustus]